VVCAGQSVLPRRLLWTGHFATIRGRKNAGRIFGGQASLKRQDLGMDK
jgi:hypothetical protein